MKKSSQQKIIINKETLTNTRIVVAPKTLTMQSPNFPSSSFESDEISSASL